MAGSDKRTEVSLNIKNRLKIHENEAGLFWGALGLIFLIRLGSLIFNNYTLTVFLKRFGVESLPILYMVNPFITLILVGKLAMLKEKVSAYDRLLGMLMISSLFVLAFWGGALGKWAWIYPVLFVVKVQFEALLGILFWNLCNDLFNFNQSKRLFPLITAGGVIGDLAGNLISVVFSWTGNMSYMMPVYSLILFLGVYIVRTLAPRFPLKVVRSPGHFQEKGGLSRVAAVKTLAKKASLIKVVVVLTFCANVILPVMNYQFNAAIDNSIAGEEGMLLFLGTFRGIMSLVSLVLLFFSGRVYEKWSIPSAMLFHPANYLFVFLAFLFRFDLVSAIYARFSTNVIRTTFNQPVNNMLIGIFPDQVRSLIRPFLRGVVARAGLITGSGLVLLFKEWVPAAYLSLMVLPFVFFWIGTVGYMKMRYSGLIVELLSSDTLDLKSIEKSILNKLFTEKKAQKKLLENLSGSKGKDAVLHARVLHYAGAKELDEYILSILEKQDRDTKIRLLGFLSGTRERKTFDVLKRMINVSDRDLTLAMIHTVKLLDKDECRDFFETLKNRCRNNRLDTESTMEIRSYTQACLLLKGGEKSRVQIERQLNGTGTEGIYAGIIAAGESKDPIHGAVLAGLLTRVEESFLTAAVLKALHQIDYNELNRTARPFLDHPDTNVRLAALAGIQVDSENMQRKVLAMTGDAARSVRDLAVKKIETAEYCSSMLLFEFLNRPSRLIREGVFRILNTLDIKKPELHAFFKAEMAAAKRKLLDFMTLSRLMETPSGNLLKCHLEQAQAGHIKTILRVASLTDHSGRMRIIAKNIFSGDSRKKANALEALQSTLITPLAGELVVFLENSRPESRFEQLLDKGLIQKTDSPPEMVLDQLSLNHDRVTARLSRDVAAELGLGRESEDKSSPLFMDTGENNGKKGRNLETSKRKHLKAEKHMKEEMSLQEKIIAIQKIDIFKTLDVNQLAAVSEIAREKVFKPGMVLFNENEAADTMYVCIQGRLSISRNQIEVGVFKEGDSFGMSAFFVDSKRLITCKAEASTRVLEIHKHEFEEMLMEYPQISYEIARISTRRIQRLLKQIKKGAAQEELLKNFFSHEELV